MRYFAYPILCIQLLSLTLISCHPKPIPPVDILELTPYQVYSKVIRHDIYKSECPVAVINHTVPIRMKFDPIPYRFRGIGSEETFLQRELLTAFLYANRSSNTLSSNFNPDLNIIMINNTISTFDPDYWLGLYVNLLKEYPDLKRLFRFSNVAYDTGNNLAMVYVESYARDIDGPRGQETKTFYLLTYDQGTWNVSYYTLGLVSFVKTGT